MDGRRKASQEHTQYLPQVKLEAQVGERERPVEEVGDDLDGGRLAGVPEQSAHQSPELVVIGGVVADVPHGSVLQCFRWGEGQ